eukprot:m.453383 g.453383  ORF g.453383 m.453383 type:complete len:364 (+) comp20487_c0_seq1:122-1213(+)
MDDIDLWNLGQDSGSTAGPAVQATYEDGSDGSRGAHNRHGGGEYESEGFPERGGQYEGETPPYPGGFGAPVISAQPRVGADGLPLGPEPDVVNEGEVRRNRAMSMTMRDALSSGVGEEEDVDDGRALVRGTPLPKWFRMVAEVTAFIYLILAIISIVENNVFDGLFFGSITSTGLSMQLALRGASPPTLPGNFCGGRGPNQLPAAWFIAGVVWLAVTNTAAWSVRLDLHLKVYAISFLLWAAFDLFLLIVMQEFKVFGLDAIVVLTLFIFNIFFQYEGYKQDEETFIAFCCLVVVVHIPLNVLQITYHDDCNEALRARFLPPPTDDDDDDESLIQETPIDSTLGVGRRLHYSTSPYVPPPQTL